jgi:hypothetical protein
LSHSSGLGRGDKWKDYICTNTICAYLGFDLASKGLDEALDVANPAPSEDVAGVQLLPLSRDLPLVSLGDSLGGGRAGGRIHLDNTAFCRLCVYSAWQQINKQTNKTQLPSSGRVLLYRCI